MFMKWCKGDLMAGVMEVFVYEPFSCMLTC